MTEADRRRVRELWELEREITPPRDLWPGIAGAIQSDARPTERRWRAEPPRPRWFAPLAAAATIAVLGIAVWVGRSTAPVQVIARDTPAGAVPGSATPDSAAPAASVAVGFSPGAGFEADRELRRRQLAEQLATLPPETRQKVEASLDGIRRSIADLEAALGTDPTNALLQELLVDAHQEEARVTLAVKQASLIAAES